MRAEPQTILDSIRRLVQELRTADREAEDELGVSGAQLFVIKKLGEESAMSVNELAERTRTHQSSVSVVVQRLVDKNLVRRAESPTDRRRVALSLTTKGRKLLARARRSPQDRLIQVIEAMPPENCARLAALLAGVVKAMGLENRRPEMFFEIDRTGQARTKKGRRNGE